MSPLWEPNPDIRNGRSVVHTLHVHVVLTPKYRRGPFTDEILRRCEEVMRDVCTDFGPQLRESNGERDHVHLLVHHPPKVAISRLVGSLKGVSARRLRQEFPGHMHKYLWGEHFCSPSYLAASRGGAPLAVIKEHIKKPETTRLNRLKSTVPTRTLVRERAVPRSASSRAQTPGVPR